MSSDFLKIKLRIGDISLAISLSIRGLSSSGLLALDALSYVNNFNSIWCDIDVFITG